MIASPMRRLIDELSFCARVVVTILIAATTLFVIALDEPAVITALVQAYAHKAASDQSISLTVRARHTGVSATALTIKSRHLTIAPEAQDTTSYRFKPAPLKMPMSALGHKRKCS